MSHVPAPESTPDASEPESGPVSDRDAQDAREARELDLRRVLEDYDDAIRCASDWTTEQRHAALDRTMGYVRPLVGRVAELEAERGVDARGTTKVERLRGLVNGYRRDLERCEDRLERMVMVARRRGASAEKAEAALARVEALHVRAFNADSAGTWCEADGRTWPCPTVAALAAAGPAVSEHGACARRVESGVIHYACGVNVEVGTPDAYEAHVAEWRAKSGSAVSDGRDRVNDLARVLIAEWERVEGPVTVSYVANFADLSRAALRHLAAVSDGEGATEPEGGVGTGAGGVMDPAQTEGIVRVNRSVDCPEAPAQAHTPLRSDGEGATSEAANLELAAERVREYLIARDSFYGREAGDEDLLDVAPVDEGDGATLLWSDLRIVVNAPSVATYDDRCEEFYLNRPASPVVAPSATDEAGLARLTGPGAQFVNYLTTTAPDAVPSGEATDGTTPTKEA